MNDSNINRLGNNYSSIGKYRNNITVYGNTSLKNIFKLKYSGSAEA